MIVLELLYDEQMTITKPSKLVPRVAPDMISGLSDETDLSEMEILDALRYLKSVDLVKLEIDASNDNIDAFGGLTGEGLQLAHQIKTENQRNLSNILLSGGIILVSLFILLAQIL